MSLTTSTLIRLEREPARELTALDRIEAASRVRRSTMMIHTILPDQDPVRPQAHPQAIVKTIVTGVMANHMREFDQAGEGEVIILETGHDTERKNGVARTQPVNIRGFFPIHLPIQVSDQKQDPVD